VLGPSVVLSPRFVESLELDDVVGSSILPELLGVELRLEAISKLDEDPAAVDDTELDEVTISVDDTELDAAEGLKITVAKISPEETLRLCALN
jgi:hypothetical protein